MNWNMTTKRNKLTVLIPPTPDNVNASKWWPVKSDVNWIETVYSDNKPAPSKLQGVDVFVGTDFTYEMAEYADKLKAILIPAAGYERIIADALPNGTVVANASHHEAPIAEWVMMVAVALDHKLLQSHKTFVTGLWDHWPGRYGPYRELFNKTFGIIGFGAIGRRVAKLAKAYDMEVIASGRSNNHSQIAQSLGVKYCWGKQGMKEVLSRSDFLLVATPLIPSTLNLIDEQALASMKKTSYLINPARGHIVNEYALYQALKEKKIAGAAIDTWYKYPTEETDQPRPSTHPFWELDNIIMTPHHSGATDGTRNRRAQTVAENIDRLTSGQPLINVIDF